MQAMVLIAIFSLVLAVAGGIAVGSGSSTQQLTVLRKQQVEKFFGDLEIVLRDISKNNLELAPVGTTDLAAYIRSKQDLRQLSSGRWSDPALDAFGNEIKGVIVRENRVLYTSGADQIVGVASGVAMLSAGPDRVFQTTIPTTASIAALQGILPPVGSDDIVLVFSDDATQLEIWDEMKVRMQRIANAVAGHYELSMYSYKEALAIKHRQEVAETGAVQSPDLETMLETDPNAPKMLDMNSKTDRIQLGVDDDFAKLERTWGNGGRLQVTSTANPDGSVTLQLKNNPANPTVWGSPSSSLQYSIIIKGSI